ncbi:MAG: hypothetical protein JWM59_3077 [Verrucomicrobiales bacterium]|nr:hypothetical protein [Verrucomicrobiales bacterium]
MMRRDVIKLISGAPIFCGNTAVAKDLAAATDASPRWKFLGDDDRFRETIREAAQVLLICIYQTSLDLVKPPFAEVVLRATVVQCVKGNHSLGDRITIRFYTDSLPVDEDKRIKFTEDAATRNLGSLKIAFLQGDKVNDYSCEWVDVPAFDAEMLAFAVKHSK